MTENGEAGSPRGSERLVKQRRERKRPLFNISAAPDDDLSDRMTMGATSQSIGAELRAARLARGETTADVARQLRLRESYIEAIEKGDFESLPGVTYVIGFLRSYARYLRLDSDDLIQRLKEEVSDIVPAAELAFLEPVSESRVPRGGLIVLALMLAVAAYGGWYYLSTKDLTVADLVPAVPEQFSHMAVPPDEPEDLSPEMPEQAAPPPPASLEEQAAATERAIEDVPAAPERLPPPSAATEPAPAPAAPADTAAVTPPAPRVIPAVPQFSAPAESAASSGASAAAPGSEGPRVYGEGNLGSRITLKADSESWIQVRAGDDTVLMTRTLKPGDSYRVPDQPGLKLITGNAGALEVLVDGQPTPAIGAPGAVKRNVALDPERLKAGSAAN